MTTWVPYMFQKFYLAPKHNIANNSTTVREKISPGIGKKFMYG
jgi:hypothetical protein